MRRGVSRRWKKTSESPDKATTDSEDDQWNTQSYKCICSHNLPAVDCPLTLRYLQ